jgi:hypothetical protein
LLNKIRIYLGNPIKGSHKGENGYKFAKENFDRTILAKQYLKHLTKILKKKRMYKIFFKEGLIFFLHL